MRRLDYRAGVGRNRVDGGAACALATLCALLFLAMTLWLLHGSRAFARDLRSEMIVFSFLVGGICTLNAAKFALILDGSMPA
jgi:hypothetical protein